MPKFNAEKFLDSIEGDTLEAVDKAFAVVHALPEAERKAVAAALDQEISSMLEEDYLEDIREMGVKELKQSVKEDLREYGDIEETLKDTQVLRQVILNIKELRGEDASPLVKAFAAAAKKLTTRAYSAEEQILRPQNAVIDAIAVKEGLVDPNPVKENIKKALRTIRGRLGL